MSKTSSIKDKPDEDVEMGVELAEPGFVKEENSGSKDKEFPFRKPGNIKR
jgi:hypothetical protein